MDVESKFNFSFVEIQLCGKQDLIKSIQDPNT